ncbi:MAG: ribonuclease HI [Chitinophagaceae bacterium]
MTTSSNIEIFTDGACSGNPGKGGFGVILKYQNKEKEIAQGFRLTTNNRMELLAVIVALRHLKVRDIPIIIYSDSQYIVKAIEKKWLNNWIKNRFKEGKKNKDLWMEYYQLSQQFTNIKFVWIKGHAKNLYNNRCDAMAVKEAKESAINIDVQYEKENQKM